MRHTKHSNAQTNLVLCKNTIVRAVVLLLFASHATHAAPTTEAAAADSVNWPVYDGDSAGTHYSALSGINRSNVDQLEMAWRYDTGEGVLETNPLIIGTVLYACTPKQQVVALDAKTGRLRWKFDPGSVRQRLVPSLSEWGNVSEEPIRGLSYWTDGRAARLFVGAGTYSLRH